MAVIRSGWDFTFAATENNLGAAAQADRGDRLTARVLGFAEVFAGRWRIIEMDVWNSDFLDLVEEAHLTLQGKSDSEIAFGAFEGFLDVRYGTRDGSACAEFSWDGHDENDLSFGRHCGQAGRSLLHPQWRRFGLRLRTRLSSSTESARGPSDGGAGGRADNVT